MVLRIVEQKIILEMLKNGNVCPCSMKHHSNFYSIMSALKRKGFILIEWADNRKKQYLLTAKGVAIASVIAKDTIGYEKYAKDVELIYED